MRIAYFDCFSGISGDMAIAAFLDAGLELSVLSRGLKKLDLKGYTLKKTRVKRGDILGTKFDCVSTTAYEGHRQLKSIISIIDSSSLNARVKSISKDIFGNIGRAEARIHGFGNKESVWLHELGSIDSIVDIAGIAIALDHMGIDEVHSSDVNMGRTFVNTAHGRLPIPGPASLELLKGVPVKMLDIDAELVTPTGAGILKTLSRGFGAMPAMKISGIGYGAGTRVIEDMPNMLRVVIGESVPSLKGDRVMLVEANIDDMNPQYIEHVFERLFAGGALDAYSTAIQMKKTRPAFKLTAICRHEDLERISSVIFNETTTIGVRFYEAGRFKLERKTARVQTKYGPVSVKICKRPDGTLTAVPEYNDCKRIAIRKRVPLIRISEEARGVAYENC